MKNSVILTKYTQYIYIYILYLSELNKWNIHNFICPKPKWKRKEREREWKKKKILIIICWVEKCFIILIWQNCILLEWKEFNWLIHKFVVNTDFDLHLIWKWTDALFLCVWMSVCEMEQYNEVLLVFNFINKIVDFIHQDRGVTWDWTFCFVFDVSSLE